MDPVTALGLTCNVLQLVDAGYRGLALCWRIYRDGESIDKASLRETCESLRQSLQRLHSSLGSTSSPSTSDDDALLDLCIKCQSMSSDLVDELDELILPARSSVVRAIGKALKTTQKAGTIQRLTTQLDGLRQVLDSQVLISTYALLKQSHLDLQNVKSRLDQNSGHILDVIKDGGLEVATLLSENALICQQIIREEQQITRDHVDVAQTKLSSTVVDDGLLTRTHIHHLAAKLDNLVLNSRDEDLLKPIIQNLRYPEMYLRPNSISPEHRGTCDWIFQWEPFIKWLSSDDQVFWIQGKAGSGKSTLMHYLMESGEGEVGPLRKHLNQWTRNQPVKILAFYFWENGTLLQRSVEGLFRSLLCQLLDSADCPRKLTKSLLSIRELSDLGTESAQLRPRGLTKLFVRVVETLSRPLCIFLDGLDEFGEDQELLDLIDNVRTLEHVKLCVSSRSSTTFEVYFDHTSKLRMQKMTEPAIEKYVQERLTRNGRLSHLAYLNAESATTLVQYITNRAQGVFLWVKLVVNDLLRGLRNEDDFQMLQRRVERMPDEIFAFYELMWNRNKADHEIYETEAALYFAMMSRVSKYSGSKSLLAFGLVANDKLRKRYLDLVRDNASNVLTFEMSVDRVSKRIQACTAGILELQTEWIETNGEIFDTDEDLHYTENFLGRARSVYVTFIHKTAADFISSSPVMQQVLQSQRDDSQFESKALESEIITWGLELMAQRRPESIEEPPPIMDLEANLPWFDVMESFIRCVPPLPHLRGKPFNLHNVPRELRLCGQEGCPSKTPCVGRHIEFDMIPWVVNAGFCRVAKAMIERQQYSGELLTKLPWVYNDDFPMETSFLSYLVDQGADLDSCLSTLEPGSMDRSITARVYLLSRLARINWSSSRHMVLSKLLTTQLLLETSINHIPRGLPMFTFQRSDSFQVICDWSLWDIAKYDGRQLKASHHRLAAPTEQVMNLLESKCAPGNARAFAVQMESKIWPINKEQSATLFKALQGFWGWCCCSTTPGLLQVYSAYGVDDEDTPPRVLEHIISQNEPFNSLEDAYRYAGWTDEDFEKSYVPLDFKDLKGSYMPFNL